MKNLSIIIILTFFIISCSKSTESMDDRYLDKVQTLDSTINSFYAAISSDNGKSFDWDFVKYVFHPKAKLIRYGPENDGSYSLNYYSPDEYIKRYRVYMEEVGFYEKEISRKVDEFRNLSHVFSVYESYNSNNEKPIIRGLNSFQLLNDGKRWWIINNYWIRETPENPIPNKFLE